MSEAAVEVDSLTHRYAQRTALDAVSLQVQSGEIFGLLGPNGSGKTTLFRILSTLIPPTQGRAGIFGMDVVTQRDEVRRQIGVVFQSPSLDKQLTVIENLRHHGHLYGLRGTELESRANEMLSGFGLSDRTRDRVGSLSGGMRRRVELAKGLLTRPKLLILDEPSTGLDPSARIELWSRLNSVRDGGVTILLTTHLMDEADRCDRLAILRLGKVLACDSPAALKSRVGGDVITIATKEPQLVRATLSDKLNITAQEVDGALRLERAKGHEFIPQIIEAVPGKIDSISVGRPTLEDVFVQLTGQAFQPLQE
jgi:ABC-2 type transport system ATP-binding protein